LTFSPFQLQTSEAHGVLKINHYAKLDGPSFICLS